jgi:subtilisin-like proprotein convertase family protein
MQGLAGLKLDEGSWQMPQQRRNPLALFGVLLLALVVAMSMSIGDADAKKKKKKKKKKPTPVTSTVSTTKAVGQPVPDRGPAMTDRWGQLSSTIDVPVTGKAKFVTDVNVTVQTTGSAAGAAADLVARLTAPSGRTITLFTNIGGTTQSIGPFKMDDDTATTICDSAAPPCIDPDANLNRPFAGTAQPQPPSGLLGAFDWVPMKGVWTLKLFDTSPTLTSTFTSWTLEVSGRSYPQKKK